MAGLPFTTWLVETDVMAERGQPVLSLVSRVFLNDRRSIIEKLARRGHGALAHYRYMVQQVKQFRTEEDFAMQQATFGESRAVGGGTLDQDVGGASCRAAAARAVAGGAAARAVARRSLLAGLSEEEAARLRELLERKQGR